MATLQNVRLPRRSTNRHTLTPAYRCMLWQLVSTYVIEHFASSISCLSFSCLRGLPAHQLMMPWYAGYVLHARILYPGHCHWQGPHPESDRPLERPFRHQRFHRSHQVHTID